MSHKKGVSFRAPLPLEIQEELGILNDIVNCIGDELMIIDHDARIVYVNEAAIRGLGYPREYLLKRRVIDFFRFPMRLSEWKRKYFMELRRRGKLSFQVERITCSRKIQTIDVTAVYMTYRSKGYILSIARDITAQREIQRRLKESEDLYRLLSEGAGDGILLLDLHGRVTYANPALEEMAGIPLRESRGQSFTRYVDRSSLPKAMSGFQKAKSGKRNIREEIDILARGRQKFKVEIHVSPAYKEGKIVGVHAIIRDIRRRKQIEQFIVESEKMKAVQFLISGTADELKHPLLAVWKRLQGMVHKYQKLDFEYIGFKEFSDLMRTMEQISNQLRSCYMTTERLVDLNRKKVNIEKRRCHPNMAIREIIQLKDSELKSNGIRCTLHLDPRIPLVAMGEIEFKQVIDNIVTNAVQAMPAEGVLNIRTAFPASERMVIIKIWDNGVGITDENLPHIFEPFFTTRHGGVEKSSGLGLSIAQSLIKACHGNIQVESNLRRGTLVRISLPMALKRFS